MCAYVGFKRLGRVAKRLSDGLFKPSPQSLFFFYASVLFGRIRDARDAGNYISFRDRGGSDEVKVTELTYRSEDANGILRPLHCSGIVGMKTIFQD